MKKSLWKLVPIAALAALFANADAQQPPAATTPPPASKSQTPATSAKKTSPSSTAKPHTTAPITLRTQKDKASNAFGMSIGKSMRKDTVDIDPNILARGIKDGLAGGKTLLTDDEAKAAVAAFQADLRSKQEAKMQALGDVNKKEGESFLANNKSAEGVVALPSGLQYKILKEGTGPKPAATDTVVCNYRGTLLNNTEFDSSYKRGQPTSFPVNGVIKGWTEALQLMPVGSKWQLFIPADLAYGTRGAGNGDIPPNATLIFEVELISIQGK